MSAALNCRICLPLPAALVIALLLPWGAPADGRTHPVLAVDPVPEAAEVENSTGCLARWLSRGFAKATLLHVDVNHGMQPLGAAQAAAIAEIVRTRAGGSTVPAALEAATRRSLFETGFIRAAASLDIVREAYWIIPFDYFRSPDPAGSLRADMVAAGFIEEDLRTFALRDGCFRGTVGGTPFAVCGLEALPRIDGPLLISLNADFVLSAAAAAAGTNPLEEMRKLLGALAGMRYAVMDAVVVNAPRDLHWVGESLAQALRDPALITRSATPKRWTLLQTVARLQGSGAFSEILHEIAPYLSIHEDDPALQVSAAQALVGLGRLEEALQHAELACGLKRGYCFELPWTGLQLAAAGDLDGGERFFAAGARLRPDLMVGWLPRGILLQRAGRLAEALRVFAALSDAGESFPSGFLAGALLARAGDRSSARRHFDRALEALKEQPAAAVDDPETARAIAEAARLYREEGLERQAKLLEGNPLLKFRQDEQPPAPPQP